MKGKLAYLFLLLMFTFACSDEESKIYVGNVRLVHQEDVNKWAKNGYEQVVGNLYLGGCYDCGIERSSIYSTIENLSALKKLKRISGQLSIVMASSLETLQGLDNLSSVGGLFIDDVFNLTSYDGFNSLDSVDGDFSLQTNTIMTHLNSFKRLRYVKGELDITTHHEMSEITGFSMLHSVGSIKIFANNKLQNIGGFSNLESIRTDVSVWSNSQLKNFCSLTTAVTHGPIEGQFSITGNAYNPTRSEIINGNCSQ